jgi:2-polyprenyl-3-methyl-5-hydroxy-6-metoxy-1,4-benzoquinol methylase
MNNRSRQDLERQHFDVLANASGEIWWGSTTQAGMKRLERRAKLVKQQLGRYTDPKVLELGCGTGAFTRYILQELPDLDLTAFEISPECVRIAAERYGHFKNVKFICKDATCDSADSRMFDVVIGNSVLHHLALRSSLERCFHLLRPKGSILFFEPNMMNPQIAIEKNIRFIGKMLQNTPDETAFFRWSLDKALRETGFTGVRVIPFDFLHPIIPSKLIGVFTKIGDVLEATPILKEFSGSLLITAVKP